MTWQVLVLISVFLYSCTTLLQKVLLKDKELRPIPLAILFQVGTGVFIGLFTLVRNGGFDFSFSLSKNLFPLIYLTLFYGLYNIFLFKSLQITEASKFSIILASRVFFTLISAFVLLNERISVIQLVGILLVFAGVVVVNYTNSALKFGKGELYALLAAMCFGFANTNDRYLLKNLELYTYSTIAFFLPAFFIAAVNFKELKFVKTTLIGNFKGILFLCLIYSIAAIAFYLGLNVAPSSAQFSAVGLVSIFITLALSYMFLRERSNMKQKTLGAILSFIGLLLTTL